MGNSKDLSPQIREKIAESFARQSMMESFGAQLDSACQGSVILSAPIREGCKQQHGFAHAAVTFGLGDSAAGYAALTTMPVEAEVLTTEMKINLLAPGQGERLIAHGKVVKAGRRLVIVQAEVFAQSGGQQTQIALMTGTMLPVLPKT